MDLPASLQGPLRDRHVEPIRTGESGAEVWKCVADDSVWYLKHAARHARAGLADEAERLRWFRGAGLPVPQVLQFVVDRDREYLLMEAAIGLPASAAEWAGRAADVAAALGRFLARLHRTDATGCPFDRQIRVQLEEARQRVANAEVNEDDFDEARLGRTADDVFAELLDLVPPLEDLVLVHGDFCLPNVLLATTATGAIEVTGMIDLGRAGVADRHQDVALAVRSLTYNLDAGAVDAFLAAYGEPAPDARRIAFFTVLDEFF